MSAARFGVAIKRLELAKADRVWFPRWVKSYASWTKSTGDARLVVAEKPITEFLRNLRDSGTPAWQRLQAVRAIELYRNAVLRQSEPCLDHFKSTLQRVAAREGAGESTTGSLAAEDVFA